MTRKENIKKQEKNKILLLIVIILIFIIGISMIIYPYLSQYLYQKNASEVISTYQNDAKNYSEEYVKEELEKCNEYNKDLTGNSLIITDPFDSDNFPLVKDNYKDLLNKDEIMGFITIESIDVYLPIFHTTSNEVLQKGVGHLENTSLPVGGPGTHCVLSAHRGLASAKLFTDLDKVKIGDKVTINVLNKTLEYEVYNIEVVEPNNIENLKIVPDEDLLTLVTCTPYGINTHRLLVHAKRVSDSIQNEEITDVEKSNDVIDFKVIILVIVIISVIFILLILNVLRNSSSKKQRRKKKYEK